jgi:hypothetical protein
MAEVAAVLRLLQRPLLVEREQLHLSAAHQ